MTTGSRACLALAAVLSALGMAACGGSAPTKKDVIARGNAICSTAVRNVRAVPPPAGGSTSLAGLTAYLRKVVPIVETEAASTRVLPRPAADRDVLDKYVAAVTATETDYRALARAAADGDSNAVAQALSALRRNPAAGLAQQYGLTQCRASAGTGVS